jgi:uncharacterized phage-associated protein
MASAPDIEECMTFGPLAVNATRRYDPDKAVHALAYVIGELGGVADMYTLLKIIFFADKLHLARYGRFIFGETYIAMKAGPVPSGAYDAIKQARGDGELSRLHPLVDDFLAVEGNNVYALRKPDLDYLSQSNLECLNEVIAESRALSGIDLWRRGHDDPAYKITPRNAQISPEAFARTLPNGSLLVEHFNDPCPE